MEVKMAISEEWLPVILGTISWLKDRVGPSKKELKMQISDLEKELSSRVSENNIMVDNMNLLLNAILSHIRSDSMYTINAETIIYVDKNYGNLDASQVMIVDSEVADTVISATPMISNKNSLNDFFVSDEEIALTRKKLQI